MFKFNRTFLRPGLILSISSQDIIPSMIRWVLSYGFDELGEAAKKITPGVFSHDTLIVPSADGGMAIGDSIAWGSQRTPLEDYEAAVNSGRYLNLRVFEVAKASRDQEMMAAKYWCDDVDGTGYDFFAYPHLIFDLLFRHKCEAGFSFAHYCTEGVAESYREGAKLDVYAVPSPTPLTTVERAIAGELYDVTNIMTTQTVRGLAPYIRLD